MKKPLYTTAAQQDLVDILRYISRDKPDAAVKWVEKIEDKCMLIASQPEMGERRPQLGTDVRSNFVGRYVIFIASRMTRSRFCECSQVTATSQNSEVV